MLFCLAPPYWGAEHHYGRGLFGREQFAGLNAALQQVEGRFYRQCQLRVGSGISNFFLQTGHGRAAVAKATIEFDDLEVIGSN